MDKFEVDEVMGREEDADAVSAVILGARGLNGGQANFHVVDHRSLAVWWAEGAAFEFRTRPVTSRAKHGSHPGPLKVSLNGVRRCKRKMHLKGAISRWCVLHPGFTVVIGGPGARPEVDELTPFHRPDSGTLLRCIKGVPCALVAMAHAVQVLLGQDVGREALKKLMGVVRVGGSISSLSDEVCRLGLKLQVRKPREERWRRIDGYGVAEERVLVVRLCGKGNVDHVVCVDVWNSLIFDGEEPVPLALNAESLRLCGGGVKSVRIEEVRELVVTEKRKKVKMQVVR